MVNVVLLLMFDEARRSRLADECRRIAPDVRCIECADAECTVLAVAPERIDLVILEPLLLRRPGAARLVSWWRAVPWGDLVMLGFDSQQDVEIFHSALAKVHT